MADVRSQRLNYFQSPDANFHRLWLCPAGMVTLFKHVTAYNASGVAALAEVYVGTASLQSLAVLSRSLAIGETAYADIWVALNPDDYITVHADLAGVRFWLSGAVLLGGPPVPPPAPQLDEALQAEQQPGPSAEGARTH